MTQHQQYKVIEKYLPFSYHGNKLQLDNSIKHYCNV